MPYIVAALVVVGLLCSFDLVLTFGVIRRLRAHTELLAGRAAAVPDTGPVVGSTVANFTATGVDGERLGRDLLLDGTLVGFFSPGCAPCDELRPAFVAHAAGLPRDRVIAVVNGALAPDAAEVRALSQVARVVIEPPGEEILSPAFSVHGYPTLCTVDGSGRLTAAGRTLTALLVGARA